MNDKIFYTGDGFAVKTLFLKYLARDLRCDHLFDYFSTFGPLQSVRMHVHESDSFGFVKFKGSEAAANALKMRHHAIDGRDIEVEIADNSHQDEPTTNDELRIESTNATGTKFMDLNDDCLRGIVTRVSDLDLCSLREWSEASKNIRLKTITNEIFAQRYKSVELNATVMKVDDLKRLLAKFGSLILEISTDGRSDPRGKLESIIQWCSGTLQKFKLSNYVIGPNEAMAMSALFVNLKRLHIIDCSLRCDASDLLTACQSLNALSVVNEIRDQEAILFQQHTFSDMKMVCCGHISNKPIFKPIYFIPHPMKIPTWGGDNNSSLLPVLTRNCTELSELAICTNGDRNPDQNEIYVKSISALKNLERLLICYDRSAVSLIKELNQLPSLRELYLVQIHFNPEILTTLSQLQVLEVLFIFNCREFTNSDPLLGELCRLREVYITSEEAVTVDLVFMVNRLPDLKKIVLHLKEFTIDEEMRSRIVDALLKSGSAKRALEIVCNGITTHFGS